MAARQRTCLVPLGWVLVAIAFVLSLHGTLNHDFAGDALWHFKNGEWIFRHGHVPLHDHFSWTMRGYHWQDSEWLFDLLLYLSYRGGGFYGMVLLVAFWAAVSVAAGYRLAREAGAGRVWAGVLTLVFVSQLGLLIRFRPQDISYGLFAVLLLLLQRYHATGRPRYLWWIAPLTLFWANAHGSFILAPLFVGLELLLNLRPWRLGRMAVRPAPGPKRWAWPAFLATAVAGAANPSGLGAYAYPFVLSADRYVRNNIQEWQAPNFHNPFFMGELLLVLLSLAPVLWSRDDLDLRALFYLGGLTLAFVQGLRFLPYLLIYLPAFVAGFRLPVFSRLRESPWLNGALLAVPVLFLVHFWPPPSLAANMKPAAPLAAIRYIRQHHLDRRMFNGYRYGNYLIFFGLPSFVDGRADLYMQKNVLKDYLRLTSLQVFPDRILNKYSIRYVFFPRHTPLVQVLRHDPVWRVIYRGKEAVIFARSGRQSGRGG